MDTYEKKYNEALERAKELIAKWTGKNKDFYTEDYAYIFPELGLSEKPNNHSLVEFEPAKGFDSGSVLVYHEGLDETADNAGFDYVDDIVLLAEPNHRWNDHDVEQAYSDGFKAGAKWQKEQDDRLVDIIYQQGIEKGKDEMRETLKRKENK